MAAMTLPQFLVRNARERPRDPAIREKEKGIWQEWSWSEYLAHVRAITLGLVSLGFRRGDKLALLSDNRPEVYAAMVAAEAAGGIPVPLYQDSIAREIQYAIDHSEARFVLAEDQEQVDKVLELRASLPRVQTVIYDDPKGLRHYTDPSLMSLTELEQAGGSLVRERSRLFEDLVDQGKAEDVALICYTSGTTGLPKGVVLTHANMVAAAEAIQAVERFRPGDQVMAYLPPAWIGDTIFSLSGALVLGLTVNCPESPATVLESVREIGPQILFSPPRIWENVISMVQVKIEDSTVVKRWLYRRLMPLGVEAARREMDRQPVPLGLRLLTWLADGLLFGALRDQLGFRGVRYAYTGGAPLGPEVYLFFRAIGVNLKQVYGLTETAGAACIHRDGDVRLATVGQPYPGTEVKISESAEILFRGPSVFAGYYKDPEATAETLRGGWLHSGDLGEIDGEGFLTITGRKKDIIITAGGKNVAPTPIEGGLKAHPLVSEAVVIGDRRKYLTALVTLDGEATGRFMAEGKRSGLPEESAEIRSEVQRALDAVNAELAPAEQVKRFAILPRDLSVAEGELTPTLKVKRNVVAEHFAPQIEAMYAD